MLEDRNRDVSGDGKGAGDGPSGRPFVSAENKTGSFISVGLEPVTVIRK